MQQGDGNEQWQQPNNIQPSGAPYQPPAPEVAGAQPAPLQQPGSGPAADELEQAAASDETVLRWQAPEYIERDRGLGWYMALAATTLVFMAASIFLIKSISFTVLIPVMAVALFVYTRRAPQSISYIISRKGIHVNDKIYTYESFRAFSVTNQEGNHLVILIPRKRFSAALTAYFPEEVGEALVDMLAARLPMQTHTPDMLDKLLAKLRL